MDGFILTHAFEEVDIPEAELVDRFLVASAPAPRLDPANPTSVGALVGPDAFTEVRYLAHVKQQSALPAISSLSDEFGETFERPCPGLVRPYRLHNADTVIVTMGSILGTVEDAVDEMRDAGMAVGALGVVAYRPFPQRIVRDLLKGKSRVVVIEKSLAPGRGGILASDVWAGLEGLHLHRYEVIAGLGGRPITKSSIGRVVGQAMEDQLNRLTFLDLKRDVVGTEVGHVLGARP